MCLCAAGGAEGPPEDTELAGLLGVLGVDAYTHDQLVAKDEGEEVCNSQCTLKILRRPRSYVAVSHFYFVSGCFSVAKNIPLPISAPSPACWSHVAFCRN